MSIAAQIIGNYLKILKFRYFKLPFIFVFLFDVLAYWINLTSRPMHHRPMPLIMLYELNI